MRDTARPLGFGLSLLVHLAVLAAVWTWQQQAHDAAVQAEAVPVQLAMFAEAPVAAIPASVPARQAPPPAKQFVEAVPEPPPTQASTPRPRSRPAPPPRQHDSHHREARGPEPAARKDAQSAPPSAQQAPATPAAAPRTAQQVALREAYKAALLAAIERHKAYPNRAKRRGIEGRARVAFRVMADGRVTDIRLTESSGSKLLDKAALSALRQVKDLPPLPAALQLSEWDLAVPIVFEIRG